MLSNAANRSAAVSGLGSKMTAVGPGEVIFPRGTWLQSSLV